MPTGDTITAATQPDDRVVLACLTVAADRWDTVDGRADTRLELEETLTAKARAAGLELRDGGRHVQTLYLKRHVWRDQEDGQPREWLEQVTAGQADRIDLVAMAPAYRPKGHG